MALAPFTILFVTGIGDWWLDVLASSNEAFYAFRVFLFIFVQFSPMPVLTWFGFLTIARHCEHITLICDRGAEVVQDNHEDEVDKYYDVGQFLFVTKLVKSDDKPKKIPESIRPLGGVALVEGVALAEGDEAEAKYKPDRPWRKCKITTDRRDGTYDVEYLEAFPSKQYGMKCQVINPQWQEKDKDGKADKDGQVKVQVRMYDDTREVKSFLPKELSTAQPPFFVDDRSLYKDITWGFSWKKWSKEILEKEEKQEKSEKHLRKEEYRTYSGEFLLKQFLIYVHSYPCFQSPLTPLPLHAVEKGKEFHFKETKFFNWIKVEFDENRNKKVSRQIPVTFYRESDRKAWCHDYNPTYFNVKAIKRKYISKVLQPDFLKEEKESGRGKIKGRWLKKENRLKAAVRSSRSDDVHDSDLNGKGEDLIEDLNDNEKALESNLP